jgi:heterodisulfide reductase subunit A2
MVEKVKRNEPLTPIRVPVTKRALVLGGGIAGIQAALDIANGGHKVVLVEKSPSIGGHMSQLSETFPTLDCSQCILTPRMVEAARHPNITLMTYSELEKLRASSATSRPPSAARPAGGREAVHRLRRVHHQVPATRRSPTSSTRAGPAIRHLRPVPPGRAQQAGHRQGQLHLLQDRQVQGLREAVPDEGRSDFDAGGRAGHLDIGAIVLATGFKVMRTDQFPGTATARHKDVIDGLQFERLASASGPTGAP